ncbi:MAG: hypothetical protein HY080_08055 [Gammaproteobacteria bacterium]|nr:hypothetical protein [Gammaproteobacteria bacterium]
MGVNKGEKFNHQDIYVNYELEEVMFRWDFREERIYKKFYGKSENTEPVPFDNRLFNDALRYGNEIARDEYIKGK